MANQQQPHTSDPGDESRTHSIPKSQAQKTPASANDDDDPSAELQWEETAVTIPIVGVGASAGGLEPFIQILEQLPSDFPGAIVFIQHLSRQRTTNLPELLASKSTLPVEEISEGLRVAARRVFVIPPNAAVEIDAGGIFRVTPREAADSHPFVVDRFFFSLANFAADRATAVVLSGSATDGALGIKEIKARGGVAIAQSPETAKFDSMPRTAIATGVVDLILPPADIASELLPLVTSGSSSLLNRSEKESTAGEEIYFPRIFALLRSATGVDFSNYKLPTIRRRLQRRMSLQRTENLEQYVRFLQENKEEVRNLYRDILIHVTRFFREPDVFEVLKDLVYPRIFSQRRGEDPVRIWVPGCSTGEEAYSIAISISEYARESSIKVSIQVFATDLSEVAVQIARTGIYHENVSADVGSERMKRYFTHIDGGYQVNKSIRDMCVFARQDLTRDPPFSRLDMIVCRNVMIYLTSAAQKKLLNIFHYALKMSGFLVLGAAETVGLHSELFAIADKRHRVYSKRVMESPAHVHFPMDYKSAPQVTAATRRDELRGTSVQDEAKRVLLDRYGPPGVVVNDELHIVQFIGQTGRFLEPAPGEASLHLLKMSREGLVHGLRAAISEARDTNVSVRKEGLHVQHNGNFTKLSVEVVPLRRAAPQERYFLIIFDEQPPGDPQEGQRAERKESAVPPSEHEQQIAMLEKELSASREYLKSIIQDLEAANEELLSANEEILSSNEELQSTNEELDTAKEELQSTNEELNTVNEELQLRNEELRSINSDLINLLASVQIAIVMVDGELCIRRFTPMAERLLNLIPSDIGRPIGQIRPNIKCGDLEELILRSMNAAETISREVADHDGHWLTLRIQPYRNTDNMIDGAVLALFDAEKAKLNELELEKLKDFTDGILQLVQQPLVALGPDLRIIKANRAFSEMVGAGPNLLHNQTIYDVAEHSWYTQEFQSFLQGFISHYDHVEDFKTALALPGKGERNFSINASRITGRDGTVHTFLLAFQPLNS